jgi:hypothetical protein
MGADLEGGNPRSEVASLPEAQEEGSPAPKEDTVCLEPDHSIRRAGTAYEGVNLVRGIESKFEKDGRVIWDEDSDVEDVNFGYAVAMGDFDCDGNHDVAIGAPYSDNPRPGGGYVQVFYSAY